MAAHSVAPAVNGGRYLNQRKLKEFEPIFYPKSIAVVGAGGEDSQKNGALYLRTLLAARFPGEIYPVNPYESEISGLKAYPSVRSIPGTVDNVIICVAAHMVPDVLDDCADRKVKVVQIHSAGFSEGEDEEGRRLEEEVVKKARKGGFRVIGPNCIGVCCPASRVTYGWSPPVEEIGSVAFITQSGGHGGTILNMGQAKGIRFSKIVSYGNGCDLDSPDFLEYFAIDDETKIIGVYLEGVKEGKRFFEVSKKICRTKPMVVLKSGKTEAGKQVAASHTGALAGTEAIWSAALKQAGAIEVGSMEELVDTILVFQDLWRIRGNRVAVVAGFLGGGGGLSVGAADICGASGLEVPPFAIETRKKLETLFPAGGSIFRNPLDMTRAGFNPGILGTILPILEADPETDVIMFILRTEFLLLDLPPEEVHTPNRYLINFARGGSKPIVVVSPSSPTTTEQLAVERELSEAQIAVYPTLQRAAQAISNVVHYWDRTEGDFGC